MPQYDGPPLTVRFVDRANWRQLLGNPSHEMIMPRFGDERHLGEPEAPLQVRAAHPHQAVA
jgi:hypothetical protein